MASYNKVILAGNLTRDPESRTIQNGLTVAKFGLAVNRKTTGKDGEIREEVLFIDIDAFGKPAETISKYCTKGSSILVEGRLKLDQWEDRNTGEKRTRLGVVLESFTFLGTRADTAGNSPARPAQQRPAAAQSAAGTDEDVPF